LSREKHGLTAKDGPELESHALTSLGKAFNITYDAHNALEDAQTCGNIVLLAAEKSGEKSVKDLLAFTGLEMGCL
jgi:DNA polymerase-3 subunit epsilon